MCIINIIKTGLLLLLISETAFISGCTDNAQNSAADKQVTTLTSATPAETSLNTEYELNFMKDILREMENQGKNVSAPLETYRTARDQARTNDDEGFEQSLTLFYRQCNMIMVEVYSSNKTETKVSFYS
ncbi:hypothetical protein J2128_002251 [Methanomicrobium sp. W14]|uniref:hypothetical protein n=1 Tax=Methanomicrobium sp. W14 TaxID=2817839 RepID=UPI001AE5CAAF|nr:hypothetical protein [Methanomicrobium sp. W14]MBP2134285.1 hypothetical protein [Methanomicrobium sp. W14]